MAQPPQKANATLSKLARETNKMAIIGRAVKMGVTINVIRVNWSGPGAWGVTDTFGVDRLLLAKDNFVLFMGYEGK